MSRFVEWRAAQDALFCYNRTETKRVGAEPSLWYRHSAVAMAQAGSYCISFSNVTLSFYEGV